MIVELCETIFKAVEDDNSDTICFLDDLLLARRNGFLSLLLTKKEILTLTKMLDLNSRQLSILNFDKENSTFINQRLRGFGHSVKFYNSQYGTGSGNYDVSDYQSRVQEEELFPISKPAVIFENENDDIVYRKILNWYFDEKKVSSELQISYEVIHGGGNTTADISKSAIDKRLGVYALCDSDKISPHAPIGSTARNAKRAFEDKGVSSSFFCIEAHEVENLVPLYIHEEKALPTQVPAIAFIKNAHSKCCESYLYYDFKDSIKKDLIVSGTDCGNYWNEIIKDSEYEDKLALINGNDKITCKLSSLVPHSIREFHSQVKVAPNCKALYEQWCKIGDFLAPRVVASSPYKM
ncbi:hypothetical protein [Vibrio vulnificus]|uniref:hypothetical protein n=1 Tax=Vibrio vulnificus TaxID=672 RepID=UPI00307E88E7